MKNTLDILYEDNHLIAVNKEAGLLSQPTENEQDSLETRVSLWIKETYKKPGNVFLGTVHRLDRPVSGVVLFAKTSKALSRLNEMIRSKEMEKVYHAWVEGIPRKKEGTLQHFLKHDDHRSYVVQQNDPEAKLAKLHYAVIKEFEGYSLLKVVLETGRYHQIRCQCAAMGHPILGDFRYGAKKGSELPILPQGTIALHHAQLTLQHPVTKEQLCIEAPSPAWG